MSVPYRIRSPFTRASIGRRGACLLILGFVPAAVGGALFVQPTDRHGSRRTVPVLDMIAPAAVWAGLWIGLGCTAMVCSLLGWRAQRVGYLIAYALPLIWGAANFVSWVLGKLVTGWISALIYLGYCWLVVVISGWDEPVVTTLREDERQS